LSSKITRRRLLLGLPALALPAWWALSRRPDPDAGKLRVIAVDVGQGDCTLVMTPGGRTLLIDGGGTSDALTAGTLDVGAKIVVPFLQFLGINQIDVLVATHPHGDHVGGLAAVLRGPRIGFVLDGTTLPYPSPAYTEFRDLITRSKIPCARAVRAAHRLCSGRHNAPLPIPGLHRVPRFNHPQQNPLCTGCAGSVA